MGGDDELDDDGREKKACRESGDVNGKRERRKLTSAT